MPKAKGKYVNHKGRNRKFTSPEELEEQRKQDEEQRKLDEEKRRYREQRQTASSDSSDSEESGSNSESESDSDDDVQSKKKGVEGLIEVENPNRVQKKSKKLSSLNETVLQEAKPELTRREREQLEHKRAAANYQLLHAKGKTEEARADLARLAIVKAKREEAARKRAEEIKVKEAEKQEKAAEIQKALGKRT